MIKISALINPACFNPGLKNFKTGFAALVIYLVMPGISIQAQQTNRSHITPTPNSFRIQKGGGSGLASPAADLDQGKNEALATPLSPMQWVNGNLNSNQSHYIEKHSVAYRLKMTNLPLTEITLTLGFDLVNGSRYAMDFITGFQQLQPHNFTTHNSEETVNPLAPAAFVAPTSILPINLPDYLLPANDGVQGVANARADFNSLPAEDKVLSIWGANFNAGYGITYKYYDGPAELIPPAGNVQVLDLDRGETKVEFTIKFTPTQSTVILAWGGHIAARQDWGYFITGPDAGDPRSAGGISGSPYHMRTINWEFANGIEDNLGNQDRSLQIALAAPVCHGDFPDNPLSLCYNPGTQTNYPAGQCPSICAGGTLSFSVPDQSGATSYLWSVTPNTGVTIAPNNTSQTVNISFANPGTYTVRVVLNNSSGLPVTCEVQITVSAVPCSITGPDPVCPGSSNNYTGPGDAGLTYSWGISGNGSITGATNEQSVTVSAGTLCDQSYTLTLTISNLAGCSTTCTKTVLVDDNIPPVFTFCPPGANLGCNPTEIPGPGNATATDNCGSAPTINSSLGTAVNTGGCNWSVTRTYAATDACGTTTTCTQVFTYVVDNTPPVFTFCPPDQNLGCNPAEFPSGTPTATDNCGSTPTITGGTLGDPVNISGCTWTRSRTWTATDDCGKFTTCTQVLTYTIDETPPTFTFCPQDITVDCEENLPACSADDVTAVDNCGQSVQITCSSVSNTPSSGSSCINCNPPAPASQCTPPASFAVNAVVNGNTTWSLLFPGISADNIAQAIRISGSGKVTVSSGDVILKSNNAVLVIDGVEFVVNNGNLKLDESGSRFIMSNAILRTFGNVEQKPGTFLCITNSTAEIGDEGANGLFNTGGSSMSANFQNDGGYRFLQGVCLNVTHDLQLSSTGNGTVTGGGLDIFINVCAEIGDRGSTHASSGTIDGDDSGNLQNNKNMQIYCSEFVVIENIQNQSSSAMQICETDFRTLNGSIQNSGSLSGTGLCLAIDDNIENSGSWTATVEHWYAGGLVTGNPTLGTESSLSAVLETCFNDCFCSPLGCNGTITRTYTATDACGNTATCVQVITLSSNPLRNSFTQNFWQEPVMVKEIKQMNRSLPELKLTVFPNPFSEKVKFVVETPLSGQATLEIFNIVGQKLQTVYQGYIHEGVSQVIEYRSDINTTSTLIYRFRVGSLQVSGKLHNIGH